MIRMKDNFNEHGIGTGRISQNSIKQEVVIHVCDLLIL
jgi:hypothetical protein